ncbi:integrase arm-type DNA-binding domain-containing protein [Agarivorans albus]|uniref:integrase arm-type DNA-binding domain-containing protein n=1 Tax=Agarivorans albus TaxID=182262 RepID=UPI00058DA107|nr:integrase arm-type DNA-binding domain-containing protein [Agarivorans albus]
MADGGGLPLRIRPNGSKWWFFDYVAPVSGKRFKISFGQYPEVSLADARRKVAEERALAAAGGDPKVHSQHMRKEAEQEYNHTLKVVAKHWFERWKQQKRIGELTANKAWRLLELHVFTILIILL